MELSEALGRLAYWRRPSLTDDTTSREASAGELARVQLHRVVVCGVAARSHQSQRIRLSCYLATKGSHTRVGQLARIGHALIKMRGTLVKCGK